MCINISPGYFGAIINRTANILYRHVLPATVSNTCYLRFAIPIPFFGVLSSIYTHLLFGIGHEKPLVLILELAGLLANFARCLCSRLLERVSCGRVI